MKNSSASLLAAASTKAVHSGLNRIGRIAGASMKFKAMFVVAALCVSPFCVSKSAVGGIMGPPQAAPVDANHQAKPVANGAKNSVLVEPADPAREAWRAALLSTRRPKESCATATYPNKEWHEVPCVAPSARPIVKAGVRPHFTGGNFPDPILAVENGYIIDGEGSFDKVTGVTSVATNGTPNTFSLQLNTNTFTTSTCGSQPGCLGWVQFIYSSSEHKAFIQYWLEYATSCPPDWQAGDRGGCVRNGSGISIPNLRIADLGKIKLYGVMGGYLGKPYPDGVGLEIGDVFYEAFSNSPIADARENWQQMEFNVFGDFNGPKVVFNPGSTLVVRDSMLLGTATQFNCFDNGSTTAEYNNLTVLNKTPLEAEVGPPSLVFVETSANGAVEGTCGEGAIIIQGSNRAPIKPIISHKP